MTEGRAVAGFGLFLFLLGWIRGSRLFKLLGLAAALAGAGLYARDRLHERSAKIDAAEDTIRSELDDLDPVAKAQVLADIARSKL